MNRTFRAVLLALFLAAIGLGIFIHKLTASDVPLLPNQTFNSWYVEAKLALNSEPLGIESESAAPRTIQFYLPQASQRYEIVKEDFINGGFSRQVKNLNNSSNRLAVFTNRDATGSESIFYRAIIQRKPGVTPGSEEIPISGLASPSPRLKLTTSLNSYFRRTAAPKSCR